MDTPHDIFRELTDSLKDPSATDTVSVFEGYETLRTALYQAVRIRIEDPYDTDAYAMMIENATASCTAFEECLAALKRDETDFDQRVAVAATLLDEDRRLRYDTFASAFAGRLDDAAIDREQTLWATRDVMTKAIINGSPEESMTHFYSFLMGAELDQYSRTVGLL